jgi:hypothetical protein
VAGLPFTLLKDQIRKIWPFLIWKKIVSFQALSFKGIKAKISIFLRLLQFCYGILGKFLCTVGLFSFFSLGLFETA